MCTLLDKHTGHDLLSPTPPPLPPPPLSSLPHAHHQAKCKAKVAEHDSDQICHQGFLQELKKWTVDCHVAADTCVVDASALAANAVHVCVKELASLEMLAWENIAMKAKFADQFPDNIPYINHLPTDVYHHFILRDPDIVISHH